jgi:hypothetical protein
MRRAFVDFKFAASASFAIPALSLQGSWQSWCSLIPACSVLRRVNFLGVSFGVSQFVLSVSSFAQAIDCR